MSLKEAVYGSGMAFAIGGILYGAGRYLEGNEPEPQSVLEIGKMGNYILYPTAVVAGTASATTMTLAGF